MAREATPLGRIRCLLHAVEFGDDAIAADLITELTTLSPPVDQYAARAIGEALKIVKPPPDGASTGDRYTQTFHAGQRPVAAGAGASRN